MSTNISLNTAGRVVVRAPITRLEQCRGIPSRRFVKTLRAWVAPVTRTNAKYLLAAFADASWDYEALKAVEEAANYKPPDLAPFPGWYKFRTTPRRYQLGALNAAWSRRGFFFRMARGVGKTKVAIDLASAQAMAGEINCAVVVAPASMLLQWADQIINYHGTVKATVVTVHGKEVKKRGECAGVELAGGLLWVIASVEGFSQGHTKDTVVAQVAGKIFSMTIDESARIKNPSAIRTKAIVRLGESAKYRGCLSGLPILKGIEDLYSQYQFLDPKIVGIGDYGAFKARYLVYGGFEGREVIGYQNTDELVEITAPYTYAVSKEEALPELPPKQYTTVTVELSAEQKAAIKALKKLPVDGTDPPSILTRVLRAQQIVSGFTVDANGNEYEVVGDGSNPKVAALRDAFTSFDEQALVFCKFVRDTAVCVRILTEMGLRVGTITGRDTKEGRDETKIKFQAGGLDVIVATLQAGGIGLDLHKATFVVYFSHSWEIEQREQSEDRAHRMGAGSVTYLDIVAENSVDGLVLAALAEKKSLEEFVRSRVAKRQLEIFDVI